MSVRAQLCLIAYILVGFSGLSQPAVAPLVGTVRFEGLERTQADFLYPFVQSNQGGTLDTTQLEKDLQILRNIPGIGTATYRLDTIDGTIQLSFQIQEIRTLLPVVQFGGIRDNIWFRLGVTDVNWRGRGQLLSAHYQYNDNRHSGQLFFRSPWIKGGPWGFTASLQRWASREPLFFPTGAVNYDYDFHGVSTTVIRHFGFRRSLELGGTYFIEDYNKSAQQFLEAPPGPESLQQRKILGKLIYQEDFRNYDFFYLEGHDWWINHQTVYNTMDASWFHSLQFEARQFLRTGKCGNLAFRLRLAIANNDDTPFAPFVVDSHVNLRGVGNRIDRGTAQAVLNAEYRHTIFNYQLLAVQLVGFSDMGTWRNPGGRLSDLLDPDQFRHFIGGGIRFIYPQAFGAVLRLDYGLDIYNNQRRGFVLGLGQYF